MFDVSAPIVGPIDVRLATSPLDRDAVFQLRHRVLGASASDAGRGLAASNGRLLEPADCGADIFAAFASDGTALASVRREKLHDVLKRDDRLAPLLGVAQRLGSDPRRVSTTCRFIIDPTASSGANLALRVFAAMLKQSADENITHDLCWADEGRVQGRLRLGYQDARTRILDASGEPMQVLALKVGSRASGKGSFTRLIRRSVRAA